jgi:hypothetical protein
MGVCAIIIIITASQIPDPQVHLPRGAICVSNALSGSAAIWPIRNM